MNDETSDLEAKIAAIPYWYHKIDLGNGVFTSGWAPLDASKYRIPDDMTGKIVLDVGAWDGYWTFEAAKRGAKFVQAIDDFSDTIGSLVNADRSKAWETFDLCVRVFGDHGQYSRQELSVYDVDQLWNKEFDHIFCFGLLYHLKHPLLALEKLRAACTGTIHIETAILDGVQSAYGKHSYGGDECVLEFYPNDEYGRNKSNWWVGTLNAWSALVEAASAIQLARS